MSEEKTNVYDPNPIDLELENLGKLGSNSLRPEDLTKPEVVTFLVQSQRIALFKLKKSEKELEELKKVNFNLNNVRENLRIKIAKHTEWAKISWMEIPISFLGGFSINRLTMSTSDSLGWVLLVLSLAILLIIRSANIRHKNQTSEESK